MIGILSTWLQETNSPVCLAMTANSLTLPPEFVNRMDERFFFDLPAEDERMEILKIHMQKRGQDPNKFQLADLSEASVNMVGREIEQSIVAALVDSFDKKPGEGLDHGILLEELERKPRIFKTMVDELKAITDWVGYDEDHDEGIRARFSSSARNEHFKKGH
jgi:SpoVK/Ycf46/Vps4 family AAA+-type ATPase